MTCSRSQTYGGIGLGFPQAPAPGFHTGSREAPDFPVWALSPVRVLGAATGVTLRGQFISMFWDTGEQYIQDQEMMT